MAIVNDGIDIDIIDQMRYIDRIRNILTGRILNNQLNGENLYEYFLFLFEAMFDEYREIIISEFSNHRYIQRYFKIQVLSSMRYWNLNNRINDGSDVSNKYIVDTRIAWNRLNELNKIKIRNLYMNHPLLNLIDLY